MLRAVHGVDRHCKMSSAHTQTLNIYFLCGVVGIFGCVKRSGTRLLSLCGNRYCRFGIFCRCGIVRQVT